MIFVLIVEDNDGKFENVKSCVEKFSPIVTIDRAKDRIQAEKYLSDRKFDLMILDMCIPLRHGESDLDLNGGGSLLDILELNDELFTPLRIVALTEFEQLQADIREKFPELGAIKFEYGSDNWKSGLTRSLASIVKFQERPKKIVYCEDQNESLYNLIGLSNIEFRGLKGGSRQVYEAVKYNKDKFGLRDRDFLTKSEIQWLTNTHFNNYFILEYYCFENYLYHPDNLNEFSANNSIDFDRNLYLSEISKQVKSKMFAIIQNYQIARNSYHDFNDNDKRNMDKNPENDIAVSLASSDFETFYTYFDMKGRDKNKGFDRTILNSYNFDPRDLVKTSWFRNKMESLLKKLMDI